MVAASVEAAAAAGAGLHEVFNYNRQNFKYDREMRQKNELQILNFRLKQAGLWRDDVRDIIGMTEKKMDSYLLIATLQLGMCVGLFCEGRLEPGLPPWLLTLYVLSLGGAFIYLFMAVWFAMHASIVANCSSVKLLTQFVRLPIPTWEHVEDLRTYASSFESLPFSKMFRLPFFGKRSEVQREEKRQQAHDVGAADARHASATRSGATSSTTAVTHGVCWETEATADNSSCAAGSSCADPWNLERSGEERNLPELLPMDPALRSHIGLACRAATQFRCFDAFCRVSMSFGTTQLLNSIMYYVLGYVAWQDGAVLPALAISVIMAGITCTLMAADIELSFLQRIQAVVLIMLAPVCSSTLVVDEVLHRAGPAHDSGHHRWLVPLVCCSHAAWLLWALWAMNIQLLPDGSMLPMRFRAVLYLDAFGIHLNQQQQQLSGATMGTTVASSASAAETTALKSEQLVSDMQRLRAELNRDVDQWQLEKQQTGFFGPTVAFEDVSLTGADGCLGFHRTKDDSSGRDISHRVQDSFERDPLIAQAPGLQSSAHREVTLGCFGVLLDQSEQHNLDFHDDKGTERSSPPNPAPNIGHHFTQTVQQVQEEEEEDDIFSSQTFMPTEGLHEGHQESASGGSKQPRHLHPGRWPAKVFHVATLVLVVLWLMGLLYPKFKDVMDKPRIDLVIAKVEKDLGNGEKELLEQRAGFIGTDPNGNPMFIPVIRDNEFVLTGGELLPTSWPSHAGFFPRSISMGASSELLVADDVGLFVARGFPSEVIPPSTTAVAAVAAPAMVAGVESGVHWGDGGRKPKSLKFQPMNPCQSLEGQSLRDVSIVCHTGSRTDCRLFVLVGSGPRLIECPLAEAVVVASLDRAAGHDGKGGRVQQQEQQQQQQRLVRHPRSNSSWTISDTWLNQQSSEHVRSLAIDDNCLRHQARKSGSRHAGCIVVGTSAKSDSGIYGRIVQLKSIAGQAHMLVPQRSIYIRNSQVSSGALHVTDTGYVLALSTRQREKKRKRTAATIEAFHNTNGKLVGTWSLPRNLDWLSLAGGGDYLLLLGLRQDSWSFEIWRFPLPKQLQL